MLLPVALGALAAEASAHRGGEGSFSCRASALRVSVASPPVFSEPKVANAPGSPCADDARSGPSAAVPGIASATALRAQTVADPGGIAGGRADASVASAVVTVGGNRIETGLLRARADSFCSTKTGDPAFAASSSVAQVRINGGPPISLSGPMTIPLGPVTVHLNRKIAGAGVITQRALEVSGPGMTSVVLAEAIADVEECRSANSPPTAVLEILTPAECNFGPEGPGTGDWCHGQDPRTVWRDVGSVTFFCQSGFPGCEGDVSFRGTSSTDPDDDIESWSIADDVGTFVAGDWDTSPPAAVVVNTCCGGRTVTLTVTDSAGNSDSDTMFVVFGNQD